MNYLKTRFLLYLDIFQKLEFDNAKGAIQLATGTDKVTLTKATSVIKEVTILGGGNGAEVISLFYVFNPTKVIVQDLAKYPHLDAIIKDLIPSGDRIIQVTSDLLDPAVELGYLKTQDLITCCYLLNELLTISKSGFVKLLTRMIALMKTDAFLLVVEPASDFQTVVINSRKWSIFDLLDSITKLKIIDRHVDKWYRVPKEISENAGQFKIHNSRTTMRLYQKI